MSDPWRNPPTDYINWHGLRVVYEIDRDQYGDLEILHFEIDGVEEPDLWADHLRDHGRPSPEINDAIEGRLAKSAERWLQKRRWNPILEACCEDYRRSTAGKYGLPRGEYP